jgi:hypothetical protein
MSIFRSYQKKTSSLNQPNIRPTLSLNFVNNNKLSPIINFTRNSRATYFDKNGILQTASINQPVFEWDPVTKRCLGLRVWGAVTNLRSYSEAVLVANAYGATNSILTTQSVSTPIQGTSSASFFALNSGANTGNNTDGMNYGSGSSASLANSTEYTQSGFFKLSGTNTIRLRSNVTGQVFDIVPASGATTPTGTITACTVQAAPNGWYRVSWSFTTTTSVPGNRGDHWCIKTPVADGSTGFWITGAQINTGSVVTPYIPTGSSTASTAADSVTITGSNFSGIINNNEGTIYANFGPYANAGSTINPGIVQLDNGSTSNMIRLFSGNSRNPVFNVVVSGLLQTYIVAVTPISPDSSTKISTSYKLNDFALSVNKETFAKDTDGIIPSLTQMRIGTGNGGVAPLNGYILELRLYPRRLPDTMLQSLTR